MLFSCKAPAGTTCRTSQCFDDLALVVEAEDVDPGPNLVGIGWPDLMAVQYDEFRFGDSSLEVDQLFAMALGSSRVWPQRSGHLMAIRSTTFAVSGSSPFVLLLRIFMGHKAKLPLQRRGFGVPVVKLV